MFWWIIVAAALVYGVNRVWRGYAPLAATYRVLDRREVAVVDAAAGTIFPAGGAIPSSGVEAGIAGYVDRWLAVLPVRTRMLIRMLFFLVEHATLFFPAPGSGGRRRFSSLSARQQVAALEGWQQSGLFARRIVFTSLRTVLTMGYFAHPPVLRQLGLAPLDFQTPVCEADLLYPRIGERPESVAYTRADLTAPSDGTPLPLHGSPRPDYAEDSR